MLVWWMNLMLALATPEVKPSKGASIYDVRSGWGDGGPKKAEEWNKISWFATVARCVSKNPTIVRTSYMEANTTADGPLCGAWGRNQRFPPGNETNSGSRRAILFVSCCSNCKCRWLCAVNNTRTTLVTSLHHSLYSWAATYDSALLIYYEANKSGGSMQIRQMYILLWNR